MLGVAGAGCLFTRGGSGCASWFHAQIRTQGGTHTHTFTTYLCLRLRFACRRTEKESDIKALRDQLGGLQQGVDGLHAAAEASARAIAGAGGTTLQQVRGLRGHRQWLHLAPPLHVSAGLLRRPTAKCSFVLQQQLHVCMCVCICLGPHGAVQPPLPTAKVARVRRPSKAICSEGPAS